MSAIFISHSSKDNALVAELRARLLDKGHRSIFLDFDPDHGIPAGRNWERELYTKLRTCHAVIVLCSEHSMASKWCFAEITQARSLGKHLFPVKLDGCQLSSVLQDVQVIDLTHLRAVSYQRLFSGLKEAGLDPADLFDWDPRRPPYPGLPAFQEQDAAVYFGRNDAIQSTLETLNRLQRLGGSRWVLILGASGSGKSSLVRAGLIPRLKRDPDHWLVLDPFRPMRQPFDELAMVLAGAFRHRDSTPDWKSIRDALDPSADRPNATRMLEMANDLRVSANRREATVLLVVDQFEESLQSDDSGIASRFLYLLRALTEQQGNQLLVLATLRSDFLGTLQAHPAAQGVAYESILLGPMRPAEFAQVIEGPMRVAGLEAGPGLVQAMVADTATQDALPLLAFTLRELWTHYASDGMLTASEYNAVGGLQGAVARSAAGIWKPSDGQSWHLRQAFRAMVRLDAEGHLVRQPARWADLPEDVHPLLEHFVQARLLVSRGEGAARLLDVAHEALFRSWDVLKQWLEADRKLLLWREELRNDLARWSGAAQDEGSLLRGRRLLEAEGWLVEHAEDLTPAEREFIQASVGVRERERVAREQQRRRLVIGSLVALFFFILAGVAAWQWYEQRNLAQERSRLGLSRLLAAQARSLINKQFDASVLTALAGYRIAKTPEARAALFDVLVSQPRMQKLFRDSLRSAAFATVLSPDGNTLLTAGCARYQEDKVNCAEGVVQRWDTRSGQRIGDRLLAHGNAISAIAYLNGGQRFATASAQDGTLVLWHTTSFQPQPPIKFANDDEAFHTAFSNDGRLLAVGNHDGSASIWDVQTGRPLGSPLKLFQAKTDIEGSAVASLAFSGDGKWIAAGSTGGEVALIEVAQRLRLKRLYKAHAAWVDGIALNPSATLLASSGRDKKVRLWRLDSNRNDPIELAAESPFALAWSPDGKTLAAAGESGVRLWLMPKGEPFGDPVTSLGVTLFGLTFDREGRTLVANGGQGLSVLINADVVPNPGRVLATRLAETETIDFSPDGRWVALGGCASRGESAVCDAGGIEVWSLDRPQPTRSADIVLGNSAISTLRYVPNSNRIRASLGFRNILVSWDPSTNAPPLMLSLPTTVRGLGTHASFGPDAKSAAIAGCGRFRDESNIYCVEGQLELWDAERAVLTGGPWAVHQEEVSSVAFSWDGRWMASGGGDGEVLIWDRAKAARIDPPLRAGFVDDNTGSIAGIHKLAFSPNDQWLAGGTEQGLIVWNIANRQALFRIPQSFGIGSMAFSGDSRRIAFNGENEFGEALVWDLLARTYALPPLRGLSAHNDVVALNSNGTRLASADRSGRVLVWDLPTEEPDEWACRVLSRNRSQEELSQLVGDQYTGDLCPDPATAPALGHDR